MRALPLNSVYARSGSSIELEKPAFARRDSLRLRLKSSKPVGICRMVFVLMELYRATTNKQV